MNPQDYQFDEINNAILNLFDYSFCISGDALQEYNIAGSLHVFSSDVRKNVAMQTSENIQILQQYVNSASYFRALTWSDCWYRDYVGELSDPFLHREDYIEGNDTAMLRRKMFKEYLDWRTQTCLQLQGQAPISSIPINGYQGFYTIMRELHTITNKIYPSPKELNVNEVEVNNGVIEWLGTPSELASLMQQLAYKGYINNPIRKDGEFNNAAFHKQITKHFTLVNGKDSSVLTYLKSPCISSNNLFSSAIDKLPSKQGKK